MWGCTAYVLFEAVRDNDLKEVKSLVDGGLNYRIFDDHALQLARDMEHREIADYLEDKCQKPETTSDQEEEERFGKRRRIGVE